MNSFGTLFRLTSYGESHGPGVGGVVDGMPSGLAVDEAYVQHELDRRRPGQSALTTPRQEADRVRLLSGIFNGRSTGQPIGFLVENRDQRSSDYDNVAQAYRPSHADYTYQQKWGLRDHRGGGRSSARETIARVVGGALAKTYLVTKGIRVVAYTSSVGEVSVTHHYTELDLTTVDDTAVRCPEAATAAAMERLIGEVRTAKDSIGGVVTGVISGCPVGLGEPCFDKLQALLAHAMLSIGAVKGFEYGSGFAGTRMRGSEHNDLFYREDTGRIRTSTNRSGGIQGGLSNGEDIYFRVAFKPTATIGLPQRTLNTSGEELTLEVHGRHDPCVVPRAVPVVEAMAAMVVADALLLARL